MHLGDKSTSTQNHWCKILCCYKTLLTMYPQEHILKTHFHMHLPRVKRCYSWEYCDLLIYNQLEITTPRHLSFIKLHENIQTHLNQTKHWIWNISLHPIADFYSKNSLILETFNGSCLLTWADNQPYSLP